MRDLWDGIAHPHGLCRKVHVGNLQPEARDCHACKKRMCPRCTEFRTKPLDAEMRAASMAGSANESPNSKTNGEGDARDLEESR